MSDELIGKRLGQYHIVEALRRGGMAMVYKAYQESLDREVAIKVLRHDHDPQFATRFKREARAIAQLQHHNILPIYDYGEQDGLLFLALQYIEHGVTLGDMLGTSMETVTALRLVGHLLDALGYAHDRGVIHRDIKPSNILMPSPTWPMLADFGIAKLMNDTQQRLTVPGLIIGTAAYMAPEQALGGAVDARTDLYATGVVLYELLTGVVPFDADTPLVVLNRHVSEPPPPPRTLNPDLPAPVEAALMRALEKEPSARYQSAAAMAAELTRVASQIEQAQTRGQLTGFYYAGVQAFEAGRWDEAVERLSQLVDLDPSYQDATELLEAAREAQEQGRIIARQQLEQVRQRRQSGSQPQVAGPPTPMNEADSTAQAPARPIPRRSTLETQRLESIEAPAPTPRPTATESATTAAAIPGGRTAPAPALADVAAPPSPPVWRRFAPWAVGGLVIVALALLLRSLVGPSPTPSPTVAPATAALLVSGAATAAPITSAPATAAPAAATVAPAPTTAPAPTAGVAATAEPLPEPAGQLRYTDDFGADPKVEAEKSGLENLPAATDFQRGFHTPGVYHVKVLQPNDTRWTIPPRFAYRDFTLQIDMWDNNDTFSGTVTQGVLFRARDNDHFYALMLDQRKGQYSVRKHSSGDQWVNLIDSKPSPLIKLKNDHNQVRIDATGDTFTIYLNGARLDSFQDSEYPFGMVGMIVANLDAVEPHMHYDNLMVWSDDAPAADAPPPRDGMVAITGGEFVMGSYQRDDQRPAHIATTEPFSIDETEVTNAAYEQCVAAGTCERPADIASHSHPSYYTDPQYANYPVVHVNWTQAQAYCAWAGKRLPTEAEWEKAASWDASTQLKTVWPWEGAYDTARLNTDAQFGDPVAVKQFPAELNKTYDMAGNVWEWTSSLYQPYPYSAADGREDPAKPGDRVFRGGSWAQSSGAHAAYRDRAAPDYQADEVGFRCAASP
jgi:serine/threonine protein kinase/formylglycine-generating enzyme required for sulfatase activity